MSKRRPARGAPGWILAGLALLLTAATTRAAGTKTAVFFGDSLTFGYGVERDEAFPALIQGRIEGAGLPWRVVNAGLSGDTTSGGLGRLDWVLRQKVDLFVLELGANDGLRGIPTETTRVNLLMIISRVRQKYPGVTVVLAGMQMPTNMGPDYGAAFAAIFPAVAEETGSKLIPFLLEGVGGVPRLNQADGIHPTAEGHRMVAQTVWKVLLPLL